MHVCGWGYLGVHSAEQNFLSTLSLQIPNLDWAPAQPYKYIYLYIHWLINLYYYFRFFHSAPLCDHQDFPKKSSQEHCSNWRSQGAVDWWSHVTWPWLLDFCLLFAGVSFLFPVWWSPKKGENLNESFLSGADVLFIWVPSVRLVVC